MEGPKDPGFLDRADLLYQHPSSAERAGQMATTYLSAAAAAAAAANYHHYTAGHEPSAESASAAAAVAMNLVNSSAASAGYCSPRSTAGSDSGGAGGGSGMPEMKYQPPPTSGTTGTTSSSALAVQNGAAMPPHPLAHNPWGLPAAAHDAWAMHPHASLYGSAAAADLKQDIKPHSPGDFTSAAARSHMSHMGSWQPPPVSAAASPYLSGHMSPAGTPTGSAPPVAPNSPSPQLHPSHPAAYGMNGMIPGQMPPHPFVDRYSRESHNSSPRSTDEDPMQPTSGTGTGTGLHSLTPNLTSFLCLTIELIANGYRPKIKSRRRLFFRRPRVLRQAVQAEEDKTGLHTGRRRPRLGHPLRQRLLADDDLQVRGPPAELQEHVQADATPQEVAGGGRLYHRDLGQHRQDRRTGPEAEEANLNRGQHQGSTGAALQQEPQALRAGNHQPRRQPPVGEGGGAGVVLQQEAEGEANDPASNGTRWHPLPASRRTGAPHSPLR